MASSEEDRGRNNDNDSIVDVGANLLADFIYRRLQRRDDGASVTRAQLGGSELTDPDQRRIAEILFEFAEQMDGHPELQSLINRVGVVPTRDVFVAVARNIFSGGTISWGRVVAFFYFACRLVIKALVAEIPGLIRAIVRWSVDYLREHLVSWIRAQGGWEGIRAHFGTPTWQMVAILLAGVLVTYFVIYKM
ncbi:apoptosis regulator BAX-like [Brachionichthys hirsutus]|uniref:apoptosis regulator BAX-like n=1 Tax=Brachionichthys hirsutus TaxID=412623 RepID=UPI00360542F1